MWTTDHMGTKSYNLRRKSIKWKNQKKKEQTIISEILSDYLNNSTIHGISYLGAKDNNWIEKIWWIIGFILSVSACTYFINKTWTKWTNNPVIISFAQDHTSIWEIPFPAVTVCPLNKVRQNIFNYTAFTDLIVYNYSTYPEEVDLWNVTENTKQFWDLSFVCDEFIKRNSADNITDENIYINIKTVAPTLRYTIGPTVKWKRDIIVTKDYFAEQMTSEGLCFTFNALGHKDMYTNQMKGGFHFTNSNRSNTGWSIESGYTTTNKDTSTIDYPLRTSQAGLGYSLIMTLWNQINERSKFCGEDVGGFKMVLHNPAEVPRLAENYFFVPGNQKVIVAVTPKVIRTSENLINVNSKTRNCYFAHERKLRFYKIYTQYNCQIECMANITRQHCGCLPFYLPRDDKTEICGYGRIECLHNASALQFEYSNLLKDKDTVIDESENVVFELFKQCNCLVSCDYLDYQVELSQTESLYDKNYMSEDEFKHYQ